MIKTLIDKVSLKDDKNPLVTIIFMAYNQERWVREAIRAVMKQDYSPLEIIISDDGSSDRTFEIMQEEFLSYAGPHSVVLNQNHPNLGIAAHLSKLVRKASGELVIYACGDDISVPHRVRRIVDVWREHGWSSILIHSHFQCIDESNEFTSGNYLINDALYEDLSLLCENNMFVLGCTSAYTRNLIKDFPELIPELVHEDCCTPFRARLIGASVVSISEPLVLYRRVGLTSHYSGVITRDQARVFFKRTAADFMQKKIDVEAKGRNDLLPIINRKYASYSFAERCADSSYPLNRLFLEFFRLHHPCWFTFKQFIKFRLMINWHVQP